MVYVSRDNKHSRITICYERFALSRAELAEDTLEVAELV